MGPSDQHTYVRVWRCACCELLSINSPDECGRAVGGRGRHATRSAGPGDQHTHIGALACACCCGRALGGHGRHSRHAARVAGQAVKTRTLIHSTAHLANFVPPTVLRHAVEHWAGAAGTRECTGVTWTPSAFATGQWSTHKGCHSAARNPDGGGQEQRVGCCGRNWIAYGLPTRNAWPN